MITPEQEEALEKILHHGSDWRPFWIALAMSVLGFIGELYGYEDASAVALVAGTMAATQLWLGLGQRNVRNELRDALDW